MIVATYSRYSSDAQRAASITDQERNTDRFASANGLPSPEIRYRDAAISGAKSDRAEYQRMLADAKAGRFAVLLVDDLYRLSRDQVELETALRRLEHWGIRVVGVSDGYDSLSKSRKVTRGVRGLVGDIYLDDLRDKTHRGQTGQALKGFVAGGRCYGYRHIAIENAARVDAHGRPELVGVRREVDQDQAAVVIEIFELFAAGRSPLWIASDLNRRGIRSPRGGTWSRSAIYGDKRSGVGILSNPLYSGRAIWNRSEWIRDPETKNRTRRERPPSDWVTVDAPELRIVPQSLWERVQARLAATRHESHGRRDSGRNTGGRRPRYLFSGMLVCAECGARFVLVNATKYGCAGHKERGPSVCSVATLVKRTDVERALLADVKAELLSDESVAHFRAAYARARAEFDRVDESAEIAGRLAAVNRQIDNVVAAIRDGLYSPALRDALTAAEHQRDQLQIALDRAKRSRVPAIAPDLGGLFRELVENLENEIADDIDQARETIAELLGGPVKLFQVANGVDAEIVIDAGGLVAAAAGSSDSLVAGAGFVRSRRLAICRR